MTSQTHQLGDCTIDVLTDDDTFLGLGAISINRTRVRCGRLPMSVATQTFQSGLELSELKVAGIDAANGSLRIRTRASFRPLAVKLMRDHSFDPIHDTSDWNDPDRVAGTASLDLVLKPVTDAYDGLTFAGFSYHYEYRSDDVAIFHLLDRASWEIDGDIVGATVFNQSACSDPVARFETDTFWTTEGELFFLDPRSHFNRVMTHNLPRWASHQAFDYQFKGRHTLLGVYERIDLIRSLLVREPGKPELKCFDKHLFDQSTHYETSPKRILLHTAASPLSEVRQQNLWTHVFDDVHEKARAEFGLKDEPMLPRLSVNYWRDFTIDTYYKDLLPAAIGIGAKQIFVDNLLKSAMTEGAEPLTGGNMCCGHEYEVAPTLGGVEKLKQFVADCRARDIQVMSWTNNDQANSSPFNRQGPAEKKDWFVKMEDTRLKYGGAYTNVFSIFDFKMDEPRRYWIDSLKNIRAETGLGGYLFDSFYNLGFMPVNFASGTPTTMWRELLTAFKELQDADVHFLIESFGPFGQPQHGHPKRYNLSTIFACYRVGLGDGYTTVPIPGTTEPPTADGAEMLYYTLAHMACNGFPLFIEGKRIDQVWTHDHRRALRDYHESLPHLHRRYLQEDGQSVVWHDEARQRATLFNFTHRTVALPGRVTDLTTGQPLPKSSEYTLVSRHTYVIAETDLPLTIV